jgi:dTMP kinase
MKGGFITLEGIEGAGKTTIANSLIASLERRQLKVQATREPGGTPLAEQLRAILLSRGSEIISPAAETLLMFAARSIHIENRIRPALIQGEWIVCDRYTDATRAYQGAGRSVDTAWIEHLAREVQAGVEPDLTLLLDVPVMVGLERARQRRIERGETVVDRFESETVEFFERVRACYLQLAAASAARFVVIDATQPIESVISAAEDALSALLVRLGRV